MMRAAGILLSLACLAATPATMATEVGRDARDDVPIVPSERQFDTLKRDEVEAILQRMNLRPLPGVRTKTKFRAILRGVELVRVLARDGNNPFNTEDPIDNATVNGLTRLVAVDDLNQLVAQNNTGGGGAGLAACIGQTLNGQASPTAPADLRFLNIDINPATLNCSFFAGQSRDGLFLILQYSPGPPQSLSMFADATVPTWTLIDPAGGFVLVNPFNAAQTFNLTLRATNAVEIRATLTVTPLGAEFRARIDNLVRIN